MKKLLYTLIFSLLLTSVSAQPPEGRRNRPNDQEMKRDHQSNRVNMEMFKIKFVTEQLSLTPQEAQAFWPVYNEHRDLVRSILKDKKENEIDLQEALLNARKKMALALKAILKTDARVNDALKVDREFYKKARTEMMRRRGGPPPPPRGS